MSKPTIISYKVASGDHLKVFEQNVANLISEGFEPYGELKILQPTDNFNGFFQVFIKTGEV